jgi:hypothetical protein
MAGLNQCDQFFMDADVYARSIENLPMDWWPECIQYGLGVARRQMKASVQMACVGNRYNVRMRVDLPLMSLGSVDMCGMVNRSYPAKFSVDKALMNMKDVFGTQLLDRLMPSASSCLIIWDERK